MSSPVKARVDVDLNLLREARQEVEEFNLEYCESWTKAGSRSGPISSPRIRSIALPAGRISTAGFR